MAMYEEFTTATCNNCGALNHVLMFQSGDSRANSERETADCFKCREVVHEARCCWIFTAGSEEGAVERLRRFQRQPVG